MDSLNKCIVLTLLYWNDDKKITILKEKKKCVEAHALEYLEMSFVNRTREYREKKQMKDADKKKSIRKTVMKRSSTLKRYIAIAIAILLAENAVVFVRWERGRIGSSFSG